MYNKISVSFKKGECCVRTVSKNRFKTFSVSLCLFFVSTGFLHANIKWRILYHERTSKQDFEFFLQPRRQLSVSKFSLERFLSLSNQNKRVYKFIKDVYF